MASIRVGRVREKIKFEVARILQTELKDPRMGFVTVIDVDLSHDFRHAKVKVSVLAEKESEVRRVLRMLEDARGFVQSTVASRLRTRVAPELRFVLDRSAEQSVKISSMLDSLRQEREEREARAGDGAGDALERSEGLESAAEVDPLPGRALDRDDDLG